MQRLYNFLKMRMYLLDILSALVSEGKVSIGTDDVTSEHLSRDDNMCRKQNPLQKGSGITLS